MKRILVSASRSYDVLVGEGLFSRLGALARQALPGAEAAALISDDTVYARYGAQAEASLREAGFRVVCFVFPHGEQSKTIAVYAQALNFLCRNHITRSDAVIALGGGVVGDLAGFTAASFQRGVRFVQVPTTLLAMVDSSVGGKTAVDLEGGKNMAGAFWQPSLVLCDPLVLKTLPAEQYRCGCAEIIKYGLMADDAFFERLLRTPVCEQYEDVIETCVQMKRDVVHADEFDRGERQKLNLGHTVGHAVEACSGFTVLHGQAVAIGMAVIARAAAVRGICAQTVPERVAQILKAYGLPDRAEAPAQALYEAALSDKKMAGGTLRLIVPEAIGRCRIEPIPASELLAWLRAGGVQ